MGKTKAIYNVYTLTELQAECVMTTNKIVRNKINTCNKLHMNRLVEKLMCWNHSSGIVDERQLPKICLNFLVSK